MGQCCPKRNRFAQNCFNSDEEMRLLKNKVQKEKNGYEK